VAASYAAGPPGLSSIFGLRIIVYVDSLGEHNPLVKQIRRAVQRGTLTDDGFAVAEGPHLVEEAVKAGCEIRAVIVSESAKPELMKLVSHALEPRQVGEKIFRTLSSTETPQGVLALVKPPAADLAKMLTGQALLVLLDGVQDPGNAGAIIRVAEAFGATGVLFLKGSVDPFHPRVLRGSAGSSFRLPILAHANLDALGDLPIYAANPRARLSVAIQSADFAKPCAIAIGGEGHGVGEALATRATPVYIPTEHVESLNAAVAAGIFLYEARRQRDAHTKGGR
jgi:RNA methyltransferase, TrmH family